MRDFAPYYLPTQPLRNSRQRRIPRVPHQLRIRMIRILGDIRLPNKTLQIRRRDTHIQLAARLPDPKIQRARNAPIHKVDAGLVDGAAAGVAREVVLRGDDHGGMGLREDGVGDVGFVGDVVHAEVEVEDDVFLVEGLAIEEFIEVDDGRVRVAAVVGVGAVGLGVVALDGVEVVGCPVDGGAEGGGVLHCEMDSVTGGWDLVSWMLVGGGLLDSPGMIL